MLVGFAHSPTMILEQSPIFSWFCAFTNHDFGAMTYFSWFCAFTNHDFGAITHFREFTQHDFGAIANFSRVLRVEVCVLQGGPGTQKARHTPIKWDDFA